MDMRSSLELLVYGAPLPVKTCEMWQDHETDIAKKLTSSQVVTLTT